jgi:hypothetical protein
MSLRTPPSIAFFGKVGYGSTSEALTPHILLIPPFAKNAMDGAPDRCLAVAQSGFSRSQQPNTQGAADGGEEDDAH